MSLNFDFDTHRRGADARLACVHTISAAGYNFFPSLVHLQTPVAGQFASVLPFAVFTFVM